MNRKEQARIRVLIEMERGHMSVGEAAESMQLSVRHTRRLLAAYRREGAAALAHGNRDRQPAHTIRSAVRQRVRELARTRYQDFNDTHVTEKLAEVEGIVMSRSSVRRIRREAGLGSPRQRPFPKHRVRRERRERAGQLVQIDGSRHRWLGPDQPQVVLMAGIDDATGEVVSAHFREQEDRHGYLQLLQEMVEQWGCPVALYHDKHTILGTPEPETIADQLAGRPALTQVGRAMADLGITAITAHSPQAKGRIERLFSTLQDRLLAELDLAGVTTIAAANAFLKRFVPHHNQRFARQPKHAGTTFTPLPDGLDLATICCFKYWRTGANDNTVWFHNQHRQLLPDARRSSYAKTRVEVHERLDGSLLVVRDGQVIGSPSAPATPPLLRARSGRVTEPVALSDQPAVDISRDDLASGRQGRPELLLPVQPQPRTTRGEQDSNGR